MQIWSKPKSVLRMLGLMLALGFVLSACDEAEQGRILMYKKGEYLGKQDPPLSEQTRQALRQRALFQQGE